LTPISYQNMYLKAACRQPQGELYAIEWQPVREAFEKTLRQMHAVCKSIFWFHVSKTCTQISWARTTYRSWEVYRNLSLASHAQVHHFGATIGWSSISTTCHRHYCRFRGGETPVSRAARTRCKQIREDFGKFCEGWSLLRGPRDHIFP
jgi:hypothetical protein